MKTLNIKITDMVSIGITICCATVMVAFWKEERRKVNILTKNMKWIRDVRNDLVTNGFLKDQDKKVEEENQDTNEGTEEK